jgi:hypothetical protein
MIVGSYEGKFHNMELEISSLNEVINQKQEIVIWKLSRLMI